MLEDVETLAEVAVEQLALAALGVQVDPGQTVAGDGVEGDEGYLLWAVVHDG